MAKRVFTPEVKKSIMENLVKNFGEVATFGEITDAVTAMGYPAPHYLFSSLEKVSRGTYRLVSESKAVPVEVTTAESEMAPAMVAQVTALPRKVEQMENLIPEKDMTYVPFGFFKDMETIIKSLQFYPVFITGLSGNGKTTMVEQACAKLKREYVRVNISIETDEDDLIGSNTLVNGNVVYREGPVLQAMRRGAILLIDEVDRGSNKLMCLQAILEGKPYFNKKTGETVYPSRGFNIIATANTKGRGTDDGKFIAAQILDEAFLERFPITVEQEYPTTATELRIVKNNMSALNCMDEDFAQKLCAWADIVRSTYRDGGVDELISTRRLVHIVKAFAVFNDRKKAIDLCINRFDKEVRDAFMDLYTKLDEKATTTEEVSGEHTGTIEDPVPASI